MWAIKRQTGFTIVELLIVIVIIGILATITIIAYNGIQSRARVSSVQSTLESVNKTILNYYAINGSYPYQGSVGTCLTKGDTSVVPNLIPDYLSQATQFPDGLIGYYAYCFSALGADYKIIRIVAGDQTLPDAELHNSSLSIDPKRPTRAWGYWSDGGSNL